MQPVKPSEMPGVGDLWMDRSGDHNLVLEVYNDGGWQVKVLTLETGSIWPAEPIECWNGHPYYCEKVG